MYIDFEKGLVPAVIQEEKSKDVLMVGYMNEESFQKTLDSGVVTFYSRSRKKLWIKGETSGNFMYVNNIYLDCDRDCILIKIKPVDAACHTGSKTCFFNEIKK